MDREWEHIQRKMTQMKTGQTEYFHSTRGEPILITKREKTKPQMVNPPNPKKAKSIIDPKLIENDI